jgi:hypothetical protein
MARTALTAAAAVRAAPEVRRSSLSDAAVPAVSVAWVAQAVMEPLVRMEPSPRVARWTAVTVAMAPMAVPAARGAMPVLAAE